MKLRSPVLASCVLAGVLPPTLLAGPPRFFLDRAGLYDAEHTSLSGRQISRIWDTNEVGITGTSVRYEGADERGTSAWFYDTASRSSVRVGLTSDVYTSSTGEQYSRSYLSEPDLVFGSSSYYEEASEHGQSGWVFDPSEGTYLLLGLTDAEHTSLDGEQSTSVQRCNAAGYVAGSSTRYSGTTVPEGSSAWLYLPDSGSTVRLGYIDAAHTGPTFNRQENRVVGLSASGQAAGVADFYDPEGKHAWFFDPATGQTTQIGLLDAVHTGSNGAQESYIDHVFQSGLVVGVSFRYEQTHHIGRTLWLFDPGSQQSSPIGLFDPIYFDGMAHETVFRASSPGEAFFIGSTFRQDIVAPSAWVFDVGGREIVRIGLLDEEHTNVYGGQASTPMQVNDQGQVAGSSNRYGPRAEDLGKTAWRFDWASGATLRMGLTDDVHTRDLDGARSSTPCALNQAGDVIGESTRYDGSAMAGQSGWFFDAASETTVPLVFSVSTSGHAFTQPQFLTQEGGVFGEYTAYEGDAEIGTRLFYWSMQDGFFDLTDLIVGGFDATGWEALTELEDVARNGRFVCGVGKMPDQDLPESVFVLVPVECPCEFDGSPGAGVFDLLAYLDLWFSGSSLAQTDERATLDVFDLLTFLDCWFPASEGAGCP